MSDRGWWNMACFNGLSADQQARLIEHGNLPWGYEPEGTCENGAEVGIETAEDTAPGPRFYCLPCAVQHLSARLMKDQQQGTDWPSFAADMLSGDPARLRARMPQWMQDMLGEGR